MIGAFSIDGWTLKKQYAPSARSNLPMNFMIRHFEREGEKKPRKQA